MKKKDNLSKKPEIIPVTINGEKYYTWPQAQILTGLNRDNLRLKMNKMQLNPLPIHPYYLFVKHDDFIKLTEGVVKEKATETLQNRLTGDKLSKLATLVERNNPELEKLLKMIETESDNSEPKKKGK